MRQFLLIAFLLQCTYSFAQPRVTVYAGSSISTGNWYRGDGGPATGPFSTTSALLGSAQYMAMDSANNLYVVENAADVIRKIDFKTNPIFIHAAISLWNLNVMKFGSLAVIPYASALSRFPAFLQQLWMESNGKSVDKDGNKIKLSTCPVIFGEPGTNSQHSFFQMKFWGNYPVMYSFAHGIWM